MRPEPKSTSALSTFLLVVVLLLPAFAVQALGTGSALAATRCPARAPNASRQPGQAARIVSWLHSCRDGTIRNKWGKKIRPLGLVYFGLGRGGTGAGACDYPTTPMVPTAAADIKSWGFNTAQVFFSWQNLEPTPPTWDPVKKRLVHHYDPAYLAALDSAVRGLESKGVAVVIALMQARWSTAFQNITTAEGDVYPCGLGMPPWIYEQTDTAAGDGGDMVRAEVRFFKNTQMISGVGGGSETMQTAFFRMWRFLATHYARDRRVIGALPMFESYDILTRTYEGASSVKPRTLNFASFFEKAGAVIHRANPRLLVMFTEHKSYTTKTWSLTRRPSVPNGVLTAEFYSLRWPGAGKTKLRDLYRRAHRWHYPLYIDEYDAFGAGRNRATPYWRQDTLDLLQYAKQRQISWGFNSFLPGSFMVANSWTDPKLSLLRVIRRGF
jgi:hypothetical protein